MGRERSPQGAAQRHRLHQGRGHLQHVLGPRLRARSENACLQRNEGRPLRSLDGPPSSTFSRTATSTIVGHDRVEQNMHVGFYPFLSQTRLKRFKVFPSIVVDLVDNFGIHHRRDGFCHVYRRSVGSTGNIGLDICLSAAQFCYADPITFLCVPHLLFLDFGFLPPIPGWLPCVKSKDMDIKPQPHSQIA